MKQKQRTERENDYKKKTQREWQKFFFTEKRQQQTKNANHKNKHFNYRLSWRSKINYAIVESISVVCIAPNKCCTRMKRKTHRELRVYVLHDFLFETKRGIKIK